MGMQKFYAGKARKPDPNGAIQWVSSPYGCLAKVDKCPCEDGKARTVYITGQPDTYFSIPAATRVRGKYVGGYVTSDENGVRFECLDKFKDRMFSDKGSK